MPALPLHEISRHEEILRWLARNGPAMAEQIAAGTRCQESRVRAILRAAEREGVAFFAPLASGRKYSLLWDLGAQHKETWLRPAPAAPASTPPPGGMSVQDWHSMALVFRAGAHCARGWAFNTDRQQDADILDAQADQCDEIARDRDGNPPVTHAHPHVHGEGKNRMSHRHPHDHAVGETHHEDHYHEPVPQFSSWSEEGLT